MNEPFFSTNSTVVKKTIADAADGQRLDNYLLRECKTLPKSLVYRLVRSGQVRVNSGRVKPRHRLCAGDIVRVPPGALSLSNKPPPQTPLVLPILFEDAHLLAVDKPAGLAVHGGSGRAYGVIERLRLSSPKFLELVHRLDKGTSGVLLLAKKPAALRELQKQWRARQVKKVYLAAIFGQWRRTHSRICLPLKRKSPDGGRVTVADDGDGDGRAAVTETALLHQWAAAAFLRATLVTGRTHQLRVHLAEKQTPIIGDDKYGDFDKNRLLARRGFRRLFLHAAAVSFLHPAGGDLHNIESPPPPSFDGLKNLLENGDEFT